MKLDSVRDFKRKCSNNTLSIVIFFCVLLRHTDFLVQFNVKSLA